MSARAALHVEGTLRDDLGAALADRPLLVQVAAENPRERALRQVVRSDAQGNFAWNASGAPAQARVSVEFDGDAFHDPTIAVRESEAAESPLRINLLEPSALRVDLDRPRIPVVVQLSSPAGAGKLQTSLSDELGRELARGTSDDSGALRWEIASAQLGEPGLGKLVIAVAGDASRASAKLEQPVLRVRATHTRLHARYDPATRGLQLSVSLSTNAGPLAQRAVGVFLDQHHLVTLLTDGRGRATRRLQPSEAGLSEGEHVLRARFDSDAPGLEASHSERVALRVTPKAHPSAALLLVPGLLSLGFALWSLRRANGTAALQIEQDDGVPAVRLGQAARGRAHASYELSGQVEDVDSGAPLAATLELHPEHGAIAHARSDAAGRFAIADLPEAAYRIKVSAPGYAPAGFEVRIPHQGTGSGVRVALRSLRVMVLDACSPLAQCVLQSERAQRIATVREACSAAVSGGVPARTVLQLSQRVEEIAYARALPEEQAVHEVQQIVSLAIDQLAQGRARGDDPSLER